MAKREFEDMGLPTYFDVKVLGLDIPPLAESIEYRAF